MAAVVNHCCIINALEYATHALVLLSRNVMNGIMKVVMSSCKRLVFDQNSSVARVAESF